MSSSNEEKKSVDTAKLEGLEAELSQSKRVEKKEGAKQQAHLIQEADSRKEAKEKSDREKEEILREDVKRQEKRLEIGKNQQKGIETQHKTVLIEQNQRAIIIEAKQRATLQQEVGLSYGDRKFELLYPVRAINKSVNV